MPLPFTNGKWCADGGWWRMVVARAAWKASLNILKYSRIPLVPGRSMGTTDGDNGATLAELGSSGDLPLQRANGDGDDGGEERRVNAREFGVLNIIAAPSVVAPSGGEYGASGGEYGASSGECKPCMGCCSWYIKGGTRPPLFAAAWRSGEMSCSPSPPPSSASVRRSCPAPRPAANPPMRGEFNVERKPPPPP